MNDEVHYLQLEVKRLKKVIRNLTGRRHGKAICKKCGEEFYPKWGTRGVYCNRACMVADNIKIYTCKFCSKEFSKRRMNAGEDPQFCKAKCYNEWRRYQKHVRSISRAADGRMQILPGSNGGTVSGVLREGDVYDEWEGPADSDAS